MVLDIFFPAVNIQVGLSFAAITWAFCLTKGNSENGESRFMVPFTPSASSCHLTLQIIPETLNTSTVFLTMATKYNETVFVTSEINVTLSTNFRIDLNDTFFTEDFQKVSLFTCHKCSSMQIAQPYKDPFYLYKTSSVENNFLLLLDDRTASKNYVYIYGLCKNTTVDIGYSDSGTSAISEIVVTYNLNAYDRILLIKNYTKDGLLIKSSDPINILVSNYASEVLQNDSLDCEQDSDSAWELLPTVDYMGTEFLLYAPSKENIFFVKIIGAKNGSLQWETMTKHGEIKIQQFVAVTLNFTGSLFVSITSSIPVQTLYMSWISGVSGYKTRNVFFVFPLVRYSYCTTFIAENCLNSLCVVALAMIPSGRIKVSSKNSEKEITSTNLYTLNKTYSLWEIHNLTDGVYSIQLYDNFESLIVFRLNQMEMRYHSLMPVSNSTCHKLFVPNIIVTSEGANSSTSFSSNVSSDSIEANSSHLSYRSYSNDSNINNDTAVKKLTNRELFPFMYEEIPDDDKEVSEYMVAVIVSLCTAIFAVIAVISIFLLKDLISKRKQIGNSKIRPFVS